MRNGLKMLALLVTVFGLTGATAWAGNVHGVLQVVKGDVQIKSGKDGKMSKGKIGGKVFPKDTIITGKDSRAKIVMVDNNVLNISPDSRIEIENYEYAPDQGKKEVLLNVLYGKVRSKVEQKYDGETSKFQVKTRTAVAGVRGTDFIASYVPATNASSVVTFEGTVAFGQLGPGGRIENPVAVGRGQFTEVRGSAPPEPPKPMPPAQLANLDQESKADSAQGGKESGEPRTPAGNDGKKGKDGASEKSEGKAEGKSDGKNDGKGNGTGKPDGAAKNEGNKGADEKKSVSSPNQGQGKDNRAADGSDRDKGNGNDRNKVDEGGKSSDSRGQSPGAPRPGAGAPTAGNAPVIAKPPVSGPAPGAEMPRTPASVGGTMPPPPSGGSMLLPGDFAGAPQPLPDVFQPPPNITAPALPPPMPVCEFCNRVIESGNTSLTIRVNY